MSFSFFNKDWGRKLQKTPPIFLFLYSLTNQNLKYILTRKDIRRIKLKPNKAVNKKETERMQIKKINIPPSVYKWARSVKEKRHEGTQTKSHTKSKDVRSEQKSTPLTTKTMKEKLNELDGANLTLMSSLKYSWDTDKLLKKDKEKLAAYLKSKANFYEKAKFVKKG